MPPSPCLASPFFESPCQQVSTTLRKSTSVTMKVLDVFFLVFVLVASLSTVYGCAANPPCSNNNPLPVGK
ncbi:hypothetical protein L596_008709 [Steinernema carpocapsae]|uniref:Transmembrane protein n=1 Tax=Steinernema carpocapsae TaxID=34508 RepID=A0A4U5PDJ7_STECR|nr:hypothetical protein L596_008709 [Steinernema carpocapsae]